LTIYAVTGILVDPLLKYMAVSNWEVADLWGIADDNRHCGFVVLCRLKFGEEGYRQCWNGSLGFTVNEQEIKFRGFVWQARFS
jgi:hypothetical protein